MWKAFIDSLVSFFNIGKVNVIQPANQPVVQQTTSVVSQAPVVVNKPPGPILPETPWMDWFKARLGWTEVKNDKQLCRGWALTKYCKKFTTCIGITHSWCGMSLATALDDFDYAYPEVCEAAYAWTDYGSPSVLKPGCIIVFQWADKSHHVTTCDHIFNANLVACLGGNQNSSVAVTLYDRKYIVATRWPVKK